MFLIERNKMIQHLVEWFIKIKVKLKQKHTNKIFNKSILRDETGLNFLKYSLLKQEKIMAALIRPEQVYQLVSGYDQSNYSDFYRMDASIRELALMKLSPSLRKKLLSSRPRKETDTCILYGVALGPNLSHYNFFAASPIYQEDFLFNLCTSAERVDFLNKKEGNKKVLEILLEKNPSLADTVLCSIENFQQVNQLFEKEKSFFVSPEKLSAQAQKHVLSFIPFKDLTRFLRNPVSEDITFFEKINLSVQKQVVRLYKRHPHLLHRLVSEGVMKRLSWPIKSEIALQMNQKKYVLELFKTAHDSTGEKAFYSTPYTSFRKLVYEKFPELDIYPKIVGNKITNMQVLNNNHVKVK